MVSRDRQSSSSRPFPDLEGRRIVDSTNEGISLQYCMAAISVGTRPDDPMELVEAAGHPAYEYQPPRASGVAKLFLGRTARRNLRDGRTLRVVIGPVGIFWLIGAETAGARWEDIEYVGQSIVRQLTNGIYTGTTHRYTIQFANGRTKTFYGVERDGWIPPGQKEVSRGRLVTPISLAQLGQLIQRGVTRAQLPKVVRKINDGETVWFGPLWVSAAAIGHGHHTLPWTEVEQIDVRQGLIAIKKADRWLTWEKVSVERVPNFHLFMELVHAMLAPPRSA
jgi:hypothetical protein